MKYLLVAGLFLNITSINGASYSSAIFAAPTETCSETFLWREQSVCCQMSSGNFPSGLVLKPSELFS